MVDTKRSAILKSSLAGEIARELVLRLHNQNVLQQAIVLSAHQNRREYFPPWLDMSATEGYAGLALLDAYLHSCFPAEGWDQPGHQHLTRAVAGLQQHLKTTEQERHDILSLSAGFCGVGLATWLLSCSETRYQRLLTALDREITQRVRERLLQMAQQKHGLVSSFFDTISGLAGIGAYLLCRRAQVSITPLLHELIRQLVRMSEEEEGLPHWYTPGPIIEHPFWKPHYPDGLLHCGLAHGIAGPLAFLSLAKLCGEEVAEIEPGIERMATWLSEHRCDDAWGVNWGMVYPATSHGTPPEPSQCSWCYGAPGIARALWLAGEALDSVPYRTLALAAMEAVYRKPAAARCISGPSLCHGVAGLLQITLRFAQDTHLPMFYEAAQSLGEQLLALYEPASLLGYRDHESEIGTDRPGLLTGATGIALALLAASQDQEPTWDRLLLLS